MVIGAAAVSLLGMVAVAASGSVPAAAGPHWAWKPIRAAAPPRVRNTGWPRNDIDRFVLARLESGGRTPAPEGPWPARVRRLSYDLTGLPPDAVPPRGDGLKPWAELVDRYLQSPAYGEHQARWWLDLARYADSNGYEFDEPRPDAWRYRDYVVRSFNSDLPYDRFIAEQIAGDELPDATIDSRIATGFNLLGPDMTDASDQAARRRNTLNDMTDTLGLAVMGVTIACARCHDHKWDPFSMADYYRLQACFTPVRFRTDLPVGTPEEQRAHEREAALHRASLDDAGRAVRAALGADTTPRNPAEFARAVEGLAAARAAEARKAWDRLRALEMARPRPPQAIGLANGAEAAPITHVPPRGIAAGPGTPAHPGAPRILGGREFGGSPEGAGRRVALAGWLTDPGHPLTRRVIVNRVWQRMFGRGLIATSSDLGVRGAPPDHPELLDWLADWFGRPAGRGGGGWSLKALFRLLANSATYRQAAVAGLSELGPTLPAGQARRRLSAEEIRDSILLVSGRLNPKMGGPGVFPPMDGGAEGGRSAWRPSADPADRVRRTLYTFQRRNVRHSLLEVFDAPDTNQSCPRRESSTTAPQALALMNDPEILLSARYLAGRVVSQVPRGQSPGAVRAAWVRLAYLATLHREPSPEELRDGAGFLDAQAALLGERDARQLATPLSAAGKPADGGHAPRGGAALTDLCLALFNSNEYLYLD